MQKTTLTVTHPTGQYDIIIGRNLYPTLRTIANLDNRPYIVISDDNVAPLYANQFADALAVIVVPAGEQHKNLQTVEMLYGKMLAAGLDRSGTVVALGGGVVGDMAGFAAASYMRGVNFVQCPTSLLAMVDASAGGKVGVDLPQGKNLVGAFLQPQAVLIDLDTLHTLPAVEFASGMAEIIKHGILANAELFDFVTREGENLSPNHPLLHELVADAVAVKRKAVQKDPFEQIGVRALLNLGHTFGHAIEQVSGYAVRHGHAVAMGLVIAARVSAELKHCSPDLIPRIEQTLQAVNLPIRIPKELLVDAIMAAMQSDKKKKAGSLRYILIREMGDCFISAAVPPTLLHKILASLHD